MLCDGLWRWFGKGCVHKVNHTSDTNARNILAAVTCRPKLTDPAAHYLRTPLSVCNATEMLTVLEVQILESISFSAPVY